MEEIQNYSGKRFIFDLVIVTIILELFLFILLKVFLPVDNISKEQINNNNHSIDQIANFIINQ